MNVFSLILGAVPFLGGALAFSNIWWRARASQVEMLVSQPAFKANKSALDLEFVKAAAHGNVARLKILLAQGADINYVFRGQYSGMDCVIDGMSALSAASDTQGNLNAVKFLVAHGADVNCRDDDSNANGWIPIGHSLWCNDLSVTRFLIQHGTDVNTAGQAGETVLMIGVEGGTPEAVEMLLAAGAKPNTLDDSGDCALDEASDAPTIKLLLAHGAIAHNKYARPALWSEVEREDIAGVRLLLDHGADVNSRNEAGQTPLMMACDREYGEGWIPSPNPTLITLLIRRGADVNARDKQGRTAIGHLKNNPLEPEYDSDGRKRDMAVIRLLKQAGAKT